MKESTPSNSFRVAKIRGMFDYTQDKIKERFTGEIEDFNDWNVGLIYGNSGTGKTTIAKELFGEYIVNKIKYKAASVIDDMPQEASSEDIVKTFNSVGFSSAPSWFKPYSVLSNGEKMRVDLAYSILSSKDIFAFDEFTSVVDRTVAQIGSFAIQKAIRKAGKKFIAITCHDDVKEWLMPDWIFCTNNMTFSDMRGLKKNRPDIKVEYRRIEPREREEVWSIFRKYHYLNHDLNKGCHGYVMYCNDKLCGFMAIIHFPHPKSDNIKKVHRLVILPDFQGIGLGKYLLDKGQQYYINNRYIITTSNPALMMTLKKDKEWKCFSYGINGPHSGTLKSRKFGQKRRITSSWERLSK